MLCGDPNHAPHEAYLALGANLGNRLHNLRQACERLQAANVFVQARSPVFETDAVAQEPQPAYLNAVVRVRSFLAPEVMLATAMSIERALGRQRSAESRWAPRPIDIDIVLYNNLICTTANLTLPHPRLLERAFVRVPLAAVARSGLQHPITGERLDVAEAHPGVRPWPWGLTPP